MATKPTAKPVEAPEETELQLGSFKFAIALRWDDNTKRGLFTLRAGAGCEDITFNFGPAGGGIQTKGGDPGGPPCP